MLLYAIALEGHDETEKAAKPIRLATHGALALRTNFKAFAERNSHGSAELAKCWRRAWYAKSSPDLGSNRGPEKGQQVEEALFSSSYA